MKKIILSLIVVFQLLVFLPVSAEENEVPVYMFTKDGCSACDYAYGYFEKLESEEPDLFELISIEVFDLEGEVTHQNAATLLLGVYERFDEDSSKISTPTIVIGDYHVLGFPQDDSVIYDAIMKVKNSEEPVDEVEKIANESNINIDEIKKTDADMPSVKDDEKENGKYDTIIIIGIFVVLIGGFAGLVIAGKKK